MISSAVVIPERPEAQSPPTSLKRRQSSISEDNYKRPRLEARSSIDEATVTRESPTHAPGSPPARRKALAAKGEAEERKRGQRLFGALLGTLSQRSTKPAHKKRDEIEQRQREKSRRETEEREEERKRKRARLDEVRQEEQKIWNRESTRIRHQNMRIMAGFLQTRTEPKLYYKPWDLRPEEEEQIKRQIANVDDAIQQELSESRADDKSLRDNIQDSDVPSKPSTTPKETIDDDQTMQDQREPSIDKNTENDTKGGEQNEVNPAEEEDVTLKSDHHKDDDHAGEELVEGQEDDVMY